MDHEESERKGGGEEGRGGEERGGWRGITEAGKNRREGKVGEGEEKEEKEEIMNFY